MKELMPATRAILREVEEKTGRPIQFVQDDQLSMLTTIQFARNGAEFHVVQYKPSNDPLDYILAYQAGFALRLFDNPPDRRFDFSPTSQAAGKVAAMFKDGKTLSAQEQAALPQVSEKVAEWALITLRSMPIGMRIDQWIAKEHPTLREQQAASIAQQQQQNASLLALRIMGFLIPSALFGPMAAYALFSDRMAGQGASAVPFEAAGALKLGESLLKIWDETPTDAKHDCQLVDKWVDACGLAGSHQWTPYTP